MENTKSVLKVQAKKTPRDLAAPERYYLQAVKNGNTNLERLAYLISNQSTVREPDCLAVLHAFVHNMLDELSQGRVVQLGALGNFQIGVTSEGSDLPEEVNLSNLKKVRLNYRPGKKIQKVINQMDFQIQGYSEPV